MTAAERLERDERVMSLFFAGHSYRSIARAVGLRSPQSVGDIVWRELGRSESRRRVRTELGRALFVERTEALLASQWRAALAGDYAATKVCMSVLEDQARFYGLVGGSA